MKSALQRGERTELRGFGVFVVKPRKRGVGRNPRTGEVTDIPPGKTIRFKPGKELQSDRGDVCARPTRSDNSYTPYSSAIVRRRASTKQQWLLRAVPRLYSSLRGKPGISDLRSSIPTNRIRSTNAGSARHRDGWLASLASSVAVWNYVRHHNHNGSVVVRGERRG